MICHVVAFSRLSFYYVKNSRPQKNTLWSASFVRQNVLKREEKGFAYFDFDSIILHASFLYVRRDKKDVFLTNPAYKSDWSSLLYKGKIYLSQGRTQFLY